MLSCVQWIVSITFFFGLYVCLSCYVHPTRKYIVYMEPSPLSLKGCKILVCDRYFGGIYMTSHLRWLGPSVCPISSERLPKYSPLLRQARATEDLFYTDLNETRTLMVTPIDIHYIIDHSYMMTCLTNVEYCKRLESHWDQISRWYLYFSLMFEGLSSPVNWKKKYSML